MPPSFLQLEEMTENHKTSLLELETVHDDTLLTLQEEHARTVKSKQLFKTCSSPVPASCRGKKKRWFHLPTDLKMAHEQQKKSQEEEFEKIRLSLQVHSDFF